MLSDAIKKGIEKAPHRALLKSMGYTDENCAPADRSLPCK